MSYINVVSENIFAYWADWFFREIIRRTRDVSINQAISANNRVISRAAACVLSRCEVFGEWTSFGQGVTVAKAYAIPAGAKSLGYSMALNLALNRGLSRSTTRPTLCSPCRQCERTRLQHSPRLSLCRPLLASASQLPVIVQTSPLLTAARPPSRSCSSAMRRRGRM